MTRHVIAMAALFLVSSMALADIDSGPKPGEKIPELKVFAAVGPLEGKDVDYAKERGEQPTVYVFVNSDKFSRPMARFLKKLDEEIATVNDKAESVAVWLGGDAAKHKEYLPKVQMSLKFGKTALTIFAGDEPKGWAINTDAHATAVVVHQGKVVKSFAFVSLNDTDAKPVLEALKKAVGVARH
jgi:hypothetical protein